MTSDLELVRLCAERMGIKFRLRDEPGEPPMLFADYGSHDEIYDPLTDDAQCMALVKHFGIDLLCESRVGGDREWIAAHHISGAFADKDANRAVCMCVAGME